MGDPEGNDLDCLPLESSSHDLFSQMSPRCSPYISAGAGAGGERYDLVDLTPGDLHFDGWVQKVRRCHDELQRFAGGENWPHAGQSQTSFIAWNRHGVEPALVKMFQRHADKFSQDWLKTCSVLLVQQVPCGESGFGQHGCRHIAAAFLEIMRDIFHNIRELEPLPKSHADLRHLPHLP